MIRRIENFEQELKNCLEQEKKENPVEKMDIPYIPDEKGLIYIEIGCWDADENNVPFERDPNEINWDEPTEIDYFIIARSNMKVYRGHQWTGNWYNKQIEKYNNIEVFFNEWAGIKEILESNKDVKEIVMNYRSGYTSIK